MGYFVEHFGLFCVLITSFPSAIYGLDNCVKKGPCSCEFSNGTGIDLTPVDQSTFLSAQYYVSNKAGTQFVLSTYYYHPCYDKLPPVNSSRPGDTCNRNLTLCRYVTTLDYDSNSTMFKSDGGAANYLGDTSNSSFSANGDSIIYGNPPSQTVVLLICAETEDKLHVQSVTDPQQLVLSLYSRAACLKEVGTPASTQSFGSTLVIIFFSFVIFYLVLGICTKKMLMGATGAEIIPNLAFWTDLPNLVKDGWAFAIAGFKLPARGSGPAMSPDPNSYDSI